MDLGLPTGKENNKESTQMTMLAVTDVPLPKEGSVLVYMMAKPNMRTRYGVATIKNGVIVIGHRFHFDMPDITHWCPLPAAPNAED